MQRRLEVAADVLFVAVCGGLLYVLVVGIRAGNTGPTNTSPYNVGERMSAVSGLDYGAADATLLMVAQSACRFCTDSMPFYRHLVEQRSQRRAPVRIVALMYESRDGARYLAANGVAVDAIYAVSPEDIRNLPTPTLILVDKAGRIAGLWRGTLSPTREQDVLDRSLATKSAAHSQPGTPRVSRVEPQ